MLGFKVIESNEFLDTAGISISYTIKSPIFGDNDNGSFIFNTTIPATDKNKKICKFPMRIEGFREMRIEEPVDVYFTGLMIWSGLMIAKFARPEEIEVTIYLGRGELNYLAKNKKISDLVPEEVYPVGHVEQVTDPLSGIVHDCAIIDGFDEIPNKAYPEVNYAVFPLKIEDLCASMGNAFNNAYYNTSSNVNLWDLEHQKFMTPFVTGDQYLLISTVTDPDTHTNQITYLLPYNIFIPFPYNSWVLKSVFKSLGYSIENNVFETDPDLKKLIIYNIQTLNEYKNSNEGPWTQLVTDDENGNYTLTTKRYLYALQPKIQFNLADHISPIDVKTYLRSLENLFFFRFFIDHKKRSVSIKFLKDIVMSIEYEDITEKVVEISERKMDYDKIATLKQNFDSNDGNGGFIKTKEEIDEFERINDVWYQGDLPANPFGNYENKIAYALMQKKWFVCSSFADDFNHTSTWDFYAFEHYCEKKLREDGKDWTTEASSPACSHFVDYRPGTDFVKYAWHLPNTKQALRFYNAYKTEKNTCGLRFLFYRGMQDCKMEVNEPVEFVRISDEKYSDCRNSLDVVKQYIDLPNEVIPNVNTNYVMVQQGQWKLRPQIADNICIHILSGALTLNDVVNELYSIIGSAWIDTIIATYCTIFINNNPIATIYQKKYPLATNDVYGADTAKIPEANLSLKWDGEYGIYNKLAKDFLYWFNNIAKQVTIIFQPSPADLFFDFSKKIRVNGIDYLVDEIRGEIRDSSISVAEADCYSI